MNSINNDNLQANETTQCFVCNRELDYLTASVSTDVSDTIYICSGAILQKIFVYGRYIGVKYGALSISKYFSIQETIKNRHILCFVRV